MSEHTPTTQEVHDAYVDRKDFETQIRTGLHADDTASTVGFYRWLATHDAQHLGALIALIDDSPAVLWAGKGGVKERLVAEAARLQEDAA